MFGSAGVALIYTSALLGRADGRSELEVALDEGDRDRCAGLPSGASCTAPGDCKYGETAGLRSRIRMWWDGAWRAPGDEDHDDSLCDMIETNGKNC
jgi:hypothetical protein